MKFRIGNFSVACVLFIFGMVDGVSAQTLAGYLNLSSRQPQPGELIEVEVLLNLADQTEKLGAYEARLQWNPEVLELREIVDGTAPQFAAPQTRIEDGELSFSAFDVQGTDGIVHLLKVRFDVIGDPGQSTSLNLSFSVLVAARTFADLLELLQTLPASIRIAGASPQRMIVAWFENSAVESREGSFATEIFLDLSGIPEKLGAYEARLSWDSEVLELIEALDGDAEEFAGPQTRAGAGELVFSHFNVEGAGERLSLLKVRFAIDEGASIADGHLELSFTALAAAGGFDDLLPWLEIRSVAASSIETHSWGKIKSFWRR